MSNMGWTIDGEYVSSEVDEAVKPRWKGIKGLDPDV